MNAPPARMRLDIINHLHTLTRNTLRLAFNRNLPSVKVHTIPKQTTSLGYAQSSTHHETKQINLVVPHQIGNSLDSLEHIHQTVQRNRVGLTLLVIIGTPHHVQLRHRIVHDRTIPHSQLEHAAQHVLACLGRTMPMLLHHPVNEPLQHHRSGLKHTQPTQTGINRLNRRPVWGETRRTHTTRGIIQIQFSKPVQPHPPINITASIQGQGAERLLQIPPRSLFRLPRPLELPQLPIRRTILAKSTPTLTNRLEPDITMLTQRNPLTRHHYHHASNQPEEASPSSVPS